MSDVGLDFHEFGCVKIWGVVEAELEAWATAHRNESRPHDAS